MTSPLENQIELYNDDDMLQLSGIQHFMYCQRQWALIHIEGLWEENRLTAEGRLLHENCDNPYLKESNRNNTILLRSVRLASHSLGLTGMADAIEITPSKESPKNKNAIIESRLFNAIPIEYKRGHKKISDCDRVQVAAQSMILEEMMDIEIKTGAIFYWEERHREYFDIDSRLRTEVINLTAEMHRLVKEGSTPKAVKTKDAHHAHYMTYARLRLPIEMQLNIIPTI